jgi:putative ABC transport system permease protein
VTHAGTLVGVGVALGVVTAGVASRLLKSLLFNVNATDASSFALTVFVFMAMAALASYIPARRAMRVDPMSTLRSE